MSSFLVDCLRFVGSLCDAVASGKTSLRSNTAHCSCLHPPSSLTPCTNAHDQPPSHHRRQGCGERRLSFSSRSIFLEQLLLFFVLLLLCSVVVVGEEESGSGETGGESTSTVETSAGDIPQPESPKTRRSDRRALLKIREAWNLTDKVNWDNSTGSDPCRDGWQRIACNCTGFTEAVFPEVRTACAGYHRRGKYARVIYLEMSASFDFDISGNLPNALGKLTELRWLNLASKNLTGEVPSALRSLKKLRHLSLFDNRLTGTLPAFFSDLPKLKVLHLHTNNFTGGIPKAWCKDGRQLFHGKRENETALTIHNNPFLCGKIPNCLGDRLDLVDGTWLYNDKFEALSNREQRGTCDDTAPKCIREENGCYVEAPTQWRSADNISFEFTDFEEKESNISGYRFEIRKLVNEPSNNTVPVADFVNKTSLINVTIEGGRFIEKNLSVVVVNSSILERSFDDGEMYEVRLTASNTGGPPLNQTVTSNEVFVDFSPPVIAAVFNTLTNASEPNLDLGDSFGASWDPVEDPHSGIVSLTIYLEKSINPGEETVMEKFNTVMERSLDKNATNATIDSQYLEEGSVYRFNLTAINGVGLTFSMVSSVFLVNTKPKRQLLGMKPVMFTALLLVLVMMVLGSVVCICIAKRLKNKETFRPHVYLRDYIYELMAFKEEPFELVPFGSEVQEDFAFVVTDIESSTAQSSVNEQLFKMQLEIHNELIRTVMGRYGGLEVSTEGDSFIVAFTTVRAAVCFALDSQEDLLNHPWPKKNLRLPGCQEVKALNGELVFAGARVRMGIHWANIPDLANVEQGGDKLRHILKAPAVEFAKAISDAGNGGQILLSEAAWFQLRPAMTMCKFPTVCQLGLYRMRARDNTFEQHRIYTITERLGSGLVRIFPQIRNFEPVCKGLGFNIVPCPSREPDGTLTFVSTSMEPLLKEYLPVDLAQVIYNTLAAKVQLFEGHILHADERTARYLIVFAKPIDAVRFAQVAQLTLVLTKWPTAMAKYCPERVSVGGNIPLFNGPRIAMAIHTTDDFRTETFSGNLAQTDACSFMSGRGVDLVCELADVCDGGQIVLTERTWHRTQQALSAASKTISLGKHILSHNHRDPMVLMEVTPRTLADRKFKAIKTLERIEPGFYDAPSTQKPVAAVFVTVTKPRLVITTEKEYEAEQRISSCEDKPPLLEIYSRAIDIYVALLRRCLRIFDGYECKQISTARFLVVFSSLEDAIFWACHLQSEMLEADWPQEVLELEECREVRCPNTSQLLTRGLQLRVGVAYGNIALRLLSKTGQADYIGVVPNLAARVLSVTASGQILVQPGNGLADNKVQWIRRHKASTDEVGILPFPEMRNGVRMTEVAVEIVNVGRFLAKGMNEVTTVYQVQVSSLAARRPSRLDVGQMPPIDSKHRRLFKRLHYHRILAAIKGAFRQLCDSFSEWPVDPCKLKRFCTSYAQSVCDYNNTTEPTMYELNGQNNGGGSSNNNGSANSVAFDIDPAVATTRTPPDAHAGNTSTQVLHRRNATNHASESFESRFLNGTLEEEITVAENQV